MKLEIKNNRFIEIDDLIKINNISCELDEYHYENGTLKGQFQIKGDYIKDSSSFDKPFNFFNYVPFEIMFVDNIKEIKDISIGGFEYFEVERRGIETEIILVINNNDRDYSNLEDEVTNLEENDYNEIKKEVENEITNVLDQTFILENETINNNQIFPSTTKRTIIKIFGNN